MSVSTHTCIANLISYRNAVDTLDVELRQADSSTEHFVDVLFTAYDRYPLSFWVPFDTIH